MAMTNFEKLKALDEEAFVKKIKELRNTSVTHNVDWVRWLKSEDEDYSHFIGNIGKGVILPSELEIKCFRNEYAIENGEGATPSLAEYSAFYDRTLRPCLITNTTEMIGQPYATVVEIVDGRNGRSYTVAKVPLWNILCGETTADAIVNSFKKQGFAIRKYDYENANINERGQKNAISYVADFSFDEMFEKAHGNI